MATNDRIYIDEKFVSLADLLVRRQIPGAESFEGVFRDTKELVVFAAGLGYRKKRTYEVQKNGREIKLSAISGIRLGGADIVNAMAVAVDESVSILHPDKEKQRAEIFESYVNGGLGYLAGMIDRDKTAIEIIAAIVKSEHDPHASTDDAIDLISQRL
jgi:dnd system-associated protein 4